MRIPRLMVLGALLAAAAVACDNASSPTESLRPVASVLIAGGDRDVWFGDSQQLVAVPRAADGAPLLGRQVTWSSGNEAVAVVDAVGRLEARGVGSVVIAATSEGKRGEVTVTVTEADLIYEGYWSGLAEMFVLPLRSGGEPTRVLPPYTIVSDPTPSPDGSKILFVVADYVDATGDIFVVNRDGTNLEQLTFDGDLDDHPAWSPDGTRIAFRSYRTKRQGDIWVMNADGSNPVNLTPDPLPGITEEQRPAWSPDGTRIAYASTAGGNMDLWTMRADGSDKQRLTSTSDFDTDPSWSPDGARIVFRRADDMLKSDLAMIPASGGEVTRFTAAGDALWPAWSPDGRLIAFAVRPDGGANPEIYTMRPDGSEVTLRTTAYHWGGGRNPAWVRRRP